jgi:hypothetical protein
MIHKTQFFDDFVAAIFAGQNPELPKVGKSYSVVGHSLHAETSLAADPIANRVLLRLEQADARFLHINVPARRLRGPLCLLPMLVNGRVMDVFCAEMFGGLVALAIYSNRPLLTYQLVDKLLAVA